MENIEAMLCAYIEGDLDEAGRTQIEKHLQENPQHRKLIQDLVSMREMVRSLPRVKAPAEVSESLQLRTERAILLDDSPAAGAVRSGGGRWSQLLAIAAIFLLCASLCLVLYRALGPTLKPPVFTENLSQKLAPAPAPESQNAQVAAPSGTTPLAAADDTVSRSARGQLDSNPPVAQPSAPPVQQVARQLAPQTLLDVETVRKRLADSGYGVAPTAAASNAQTVLMVVNSSNPSAASSQVTQFLNDNSGISWRRVPPQTATTMPVGEMQNSPAPGSALGAGGGGFGGGGAGYGVARGQALESDRAKDELTSDQAAKGNRAIQSGGELAPATQPSGDLYVAKGLTQQQAAALEQSLSAAQDGSQCQVILQSGAILATTRPSSLFVANDSTPLPLDNQSASTTHPSTGEMADSQVSSATTVPSLSAVAGAQMPAASGNGNRLDAAAMVMNGANQANQAAALEEVDAVIIVQPTAAPVSAPPATMPSTANESTPATQPAPTTRP